VIGPSTVGKPPAGIEDPVGTGRVTQLEPLGDVTVVYVQTDLGKGDGADAENGRSEAELSTVLACKETARLLPEVGACVVLELDADRVHFFDPESGRALGPRGEND
jgi:ABC-type sugar transport system ATPase subunit